jgi:hypothetical protein
MVLGGRNEAERTGSPRNEDGIFSDNFGGLNTTASDINCPFEDSPELFNIDVDISGRVTKRKGTITLREDEAAGTKGYTILSFTTGLKYTFLIEKFGTDINVYETNDDVLTLLMTKSNVWSSQAEYVRANYVRTSEIEPRVIFTTGTNQPVQLKFVEQQEVAAGTETNFTLVNAERFVNATTSNIVVYKNRTRVTPSGVSYSSGVLTLTGVGVVAGDIIDVILVTWQHIVEAVLFKGDRLFQMVTRFNATPTDQAVEIPARLRDDPIIDYSSSEPYLYGIKAYNSDQYDPVGGGSSQYAYQSDLTPASETEYAHGNGSLYDASVGGTLTPAPFFITFGEITSGGSDPIEMGIVRQRDMYVYLNGGVPLTGDDIKVFVDGSQKSQRTSTGGSGSTTFADYFLVDESGNIETATNTEFRYITFEAGERIGVPESSDVEIIHTSTSFIGSGANADVELYKDGACEPQYGLGIFADYSAGSFPTNCSLYQNRLVYSGFLSNPLQIVFSELGDSTISLRFYRLFQVETLSTNSTDPFVLRINGRPDDYITGMLVWQRSLITFTRQGVYRVSGGNSGAIDLANNFINSISTLGLVNSYAVVLAEKSVLFLSDLGVFDLALGIDSEDYVASEKSLKIRKVFGVTKDPTRENLAWISYDQNTQKVYLGYPISEIDYTAQRLLVFNTFRESWTEYLTPGGFYTYYGLPYQDLTKGLGYMLVTVSRHDASNVPANKVFLKTEGTYYVDYYSTAIGDGSTTDFNVNFDYNYLELTTTNKIHNYYVGVENSEDTRGFSLLPIRDVQDITVQLETQSGSGIYETLEINEDYVKKPGNIIYLLNDPGDNRTLKVWLRSPATDGEPTRALYGITEPIETHEPVWVTVDHQLQIPGTNYNMDRESGTVYNIEFETAPIDSAVIRYGKTYPCFYSSPLLTMQSFTALKRSKFVYVYFNNELGQEEYKVGDVNTDTDPEQDPVMLVGEKKQRLNATITLQVEADFDAETEYDIYQFSSLVFDDSLFDIFPSANQFRRYTLFKEYLLGVSYGYKLMVWSFDETAFSMSAYQLSNSIHAERYINFTQ